MYSLSCRPSTCGFYIKLEQILKGEVRETTGDFFRRYTDYVLSYKPYKKYEAIDNPSFCLMCRLMAIKILLENGRIK